ncbi:MAG: hypothetical protein R3B48_09660 [Kofleriaceae bacterium]
MTRRIWMMAVSVALGTVACGISLQEEPVQDEGPSATPESVEEPPAVATCSNGRVVYLHFSGLTLVRAAGGQTDAAHFKADWLSKGGAMIPPYKAQAEPAVRAAEIAEITAAIRKTLGAFPITVVTERPLTGRYHMVVFGGGPEALGLGSSVRKAAGHGCANKGSNNIVWIGESFSPQDAADYAVGGIGMGLGLSGTYATSDCLCGWGNSCVPQPGACTLSAAITNDGRCSRSPQTQNEIEAFRREFCDPLP